MKKRNYLLSLILFLALLITGCKVEQTSSLNSGVNNNTAETVYTSDTETVYISDNEAETKPIYGFDITAVPKYSGKPYTVINNNVPYFTDAELVATSYESYSDLDHLDRCGVCVASIGKDIMPTEARGEIGQIKPIGWHTVKYNGIVNGNYLYNRCHLIGFQLTGENANNKNLITGTRYLNVDGMLPFENMVADYVKETGNHVLYRVTPIFEGNNLLAAGVLIEAESVEDNGDGILFCVFCYNVQPGITIDYADGSSRADGTIVAVQPTAIQPTAVQPTTQIQLPTQLITTVAPTQPPVIDTAGLYVVNARNGKIHINGKCTATGSGRNAMKEPVYFNTFEEAEVFSSDINPDLTDRKCENCWR